MMLYILACTGKDAEGADVLSGTLTSERAEEKGTLQAASAWGVVAAGKAAVYVSPNPATTCAETVAYLRGDSELESFDPDATNTIGMCNVFLLASDYASESVELPDVSVTVSLSCAMTDAAGDGSWVYEERGASHVGWFYEGPWWQGSPNDAEGTLSGGEDGMTLTLDMSSYAGQFIYDTDYAGDATGEASGSVDVGWCSDLAREVTW